MKGTSFLCILLAALMVLAVAAGGTQTALADTLTAAQADVAIRTIHATMAAFQQTGTSAAWRNGP